MCDIQQQTSIWHLQRPIIIQNSQKKCLVLIGTNFSFHSVNCVKSSEWLPTAFALVCQFSPIHLPPPPTCLTKHNLLKPDMFVYLLHSLHCLLLLHNVDIFSYSLTGKGRVSQWLATMVFKKKCIFVIFIFLYHKIVSDRICMPVYNKCRDFFCLFEMLLR